MGHNPGGDGGGGTHYISMGRDVLKKGVLFSVCLERGVFYCKKKIWEGI